MPQSYGSQRVCGAGGDACECIQEKLFQRVRNPLDRAEKSSRPKDLRQRETSSGRLNRRRFSDFRVPDVSVLRFGVLRSFCVFSAKSLNHRRTRFMAHSYADRARTARSADEQFGRSLIAMATLGRNRFSQGQSVQPDARCRSLQYAIEEKDSKRSLRVLFAVDAE